MSATEVAAPAASPVESVVTREVRGHLLLIGLNRPHKKNAFDLAMLRGLSDAVGELDENPGLRVGVIFAHGKDFTSGLDLLDVAPALSGESGLMPEGAVDPWATHGRRCRKPLVCAVQGLCLTLGIELMLACDIALAAADTRFAQIEIKRGIFAFGGGTHRWVASCGWGNAMRYLLTGDEFDAGIALRLGLVQEVVAGDQLLDRAVAIAQVIAAQAPLGVMATLASARKAVEQGPEAAAKDLLPEIRRLMASEDAREGLMSFMQRRAANFVGR
jgi:enoyl-CoA hydratase